MRKSYLWDLVQERTNRDVNELLRELYVDQRFNLTEIGDALGVSRESVRQRLAEAGISRSDRKPAATVVEASA